jgi:hypothetical protein
MLSIIIIHCGYSRWRMIYEDNPLRGRIGGQRTVTENAAGTRAVHTVTSCSCCISSGVQVSSSVSSSLFHASGLFARSDLERLQMK